MNFRAALAIVPFLVLGCDSKPTETVHVQGTSFDVPGSTVTKARPKPAEAPVDEKILIVSFDDLAFRYPTEVQVGRDPYPPGVRKLDGRKVAIAGYMVPVDVGGGKVRSFLLSRSMLGCCFADSPGITEMIKVQRADGGPLAYEQTVRVTGTLVVGEEKDADGVVENVYRIRADALAPALYER